jgi:hypothetical protein
LTTYHASNQTVVMFGGNGCSGLLVVCGDTWWWNGTNWTQCPAADCPSGTPPARTSPAMAFHQARNRTIMYGGFSGTLLNDTWHWNGTSWGPVTNAGLPQARTGHRMAYDADRSTAVVFGGCKGDCAAHQNPMLTNETLTLNGGEWNVWLPTPRPAVRCCVGLAYFGGTLNKVVMFGGADAEDVKFADMWVWNTVGKTWTCIQTCP